MRKALIVQGDPTTTRGVVIGGSAFGMSDNGRTFALYGDEATCGNCKGAFKIFGTATGRCYDGRAGVIEGDLVLCPCGRNRVLASPNPGCFYEDDSTAVANRTSPASPSQAVDEAKHIRWCLVRDRVNGEPLTNRDFVADIGGLKQKLVVATDYNIEHWTSASTMVDSSREDAVSIKVDDRSATRQAVITRMKQKGYTLLERSSWGAMPPKNTLTPSHWDYHDIVIHHAGRSYSCAVSEHGAIEQMKRVQSYDMGGQSFDDVAYHYAVSCPGEVFEARDIRFTGSHVKGNNTGKLGIVLLENLAGAGEAWQQEYSRKSLWQKLKGSMDIAKDAVAFDHAMPTREQIDALSALIATLKEFFNIAALGGHREYQLLAPGNEGRACPGKYGMQVVEVMRAKFGLAAPSK